MVVEENDYKIKVKVDRQFLDVLKNSSIYTCRTGMNRRTKGEYVDRWKEGDIVEIHKNCVSEMFSTIASGNNIFSCGSFSSIASGLPLNSVVGRYTSVGPNCSTVGFRHPIEAVCMASAVFNFCRENVAGYFDLVEKRDDGRPSPKAVPTPQPQSARIEIGNDVWIGGGVTISGGVTIGDGAIIAGKSVVTKSVAPYEIVAGSPARHKKYRFPREIIDGLIESKWWEFELADLYECDFSNPEKFLNDFIKNRSNIRPYSLSPIKWAELKLF